MIPFDTLISFFAIATLLALAPGPDNIFVLTQSALHGKKAGLAITAGLCSGLIVHTSLVAFGTATIFQNSEIAFKGLKFLGAAYLLFLAWQAFNAPVEILNSQSHDKKISSSLFLRGAIMNVTNPKVTIFFLAFLTQFTDPTRGSVVTQTFVLGGLFMAAAAMTFSLIAVLASRIGTLLRTDLRVQAVMNKVTGIVFLGLATRLALAEK